MTTETIEGTEPTRKLIVAAGRTVQIGNGYRLVYRREGEGQVVDKIPVEGKFIFTEGEEVELSASEAERHLALGYVIEPGMPQTRPVGFINNGASGAPGKIEMADVSPDKVGLISRQIY